jgi:hypothetical protein
MADHTKLAVRAPSTAEYLQRSSPFGAPALVKGEDVAAYEEILARVSEAVKPQDFLEKIWTRDVADLSWQTLRLRRLKAALVTSAMSSTLQEILTKLLDGLEAGALAKRWAARDQRAIKKVDRLLSSCGLTLDIVAARALSSKITTVERLDRMATNAEARRNAALREVERHRLHIAEGLRRASDDVVEAEFEDVSAKHFDQQDAG